ncbi:MAG TPA: M1 family aminopeptidase [Thermoanaerobaculia bacterium]|nr:M1 family aminopeptidase [Thermoanaerobaculia bacterium]
MRKLFFGALALVCAGASGVSLPAFIETADHLKLGEAKIVDKAVFAIGHVKLKMISGSAAPVMAGSEPVGFFFGGKGAIEYETTEPAEFPVVSHNVRAIAHLKMTAEATRIVLGDNFTEALVVAAGVPLPSLSATAGASLTDALKEHNDVFDRLWIAPRSHELAVQKFSFPAGKFVRAELSGGHDRLLYEYDDFEDHAEGLFTVRPPMMSSGDRRLDQRLHPGVLSRQPVGHDRSVTPSPPFALGALDYTLVADGDNAKLEVTETVTRANAAENVLRFEMLEEAIAKLGVAPRKLNVRSVTDDQGHALNFDHNRNDLVVEIPTTPSPTVKLKFSIDGDFLIREGGDNAWQLGLGVPWLPLPRQWAGSAYTVHAIVRVKKPFVPLIPGDTVSRREEGDYNVLETAVNKPVQFTTAQAGKYTIYDDKRGQRVVRVATYGLPNQRAAKQLTDLAFALIDYYEYFLGPFPFNEFNIIQVNAYGFGQAPPGTMFITNEAFTPLASEVDQTFSQGINERFAHEIAHQYWAYVVRMPSEEEQWLTESFAEYSAALALRKLKGEGSYNRLVATWRGRARDGASVAPIPYANRIQGDPRSSFVERFALLYNKGPLLLYALHKELGDTQFLTFMKSYTKSFNFKFGSTNGVAGLLQFMTKKDYRPFFEKYFWGTAMPE